MHPKPKNNNTHATFLKRITSILQNYLKNKKNENKNFEIDYSSPASVAGLYGFTGGRVRKR
jgi:hypothetical protein